MERDQWRLGRSGGHLMHEPSETTTAEGAAERTLDRIADARRRGATGAAQLADQLLHSVAARDFGGGATTGATGAAFALRSARQGVDIAVEGALEALRVAADQLDGLLSSDPSGSHVIESLEIQAERTLEARTTIWIHNQSAQPLALCELRLTQLTNRAGETLDAKASFEPGSLPSIVAGQSGSSVLCITPSVVAELDEYHGLILITGSDHFEALHVKVLVQEGS